MLLVMLPGINRQQREMIEYLNKISITTLFGPKLSNKQRPQWRLRVCEKWRYLGLSPRPLGIYRRMDQSIV